MNFEVHEPRVEGVETDSLDAWAVARHRILLIWHRARAPSLATVARALYLGPEVLVEQTAP